jgi:cytoskeleton protein RodZ
MDELGELLRSARQRKNISLSEAAAATRIRRMYLEAIESGDYRVFPGDAYITGFLRNYAAFLGLDPEEILMTYHALRPPSAIAIQPVTSVVSERLRRRARRRFSWFFGALALILLGSFALRLYDSEVRAGGGLVPPASTLSLTATRGPSKAILNATNGLTSMPLTLSLHARWRVWAQVRVDGRQVYWGPIHRGMTRTWQGRQQIAIITRHGNALTVRVNGRWLGLLSPRPGRVKGIITSHRPTIIIRQFLPLPTQKRPAASGAIPTPSGQPLATNGQVPQNGVQPLLSNEQQPTASGQPPAVSGQPAVNGQLAPANGQP